MTHPIFPCLWYDNQAQAAATFYTDIFKDSRILRVTPQVVTFEILGQKFMGLNGGPQFRMNPSLSAFVYCSTKEETDAVWDQLSQGGEAMIPMGEYPWSSRYGWLKDKFGFTWQISVAPEEGSPTNLKPCLLFTNIHFGQAEQAMRWYVSLFTGSGIDFLAHYSHDDPNAGKLMYAEFHLGDSSLIAMDGPGVHEYSFTEGLSFVLNVDEQEEIDTYWNKFLEDGGMESPCGWIRDPFGVWWQILPARLEKLMKQEGRRERVMEALLSMKKIDIARLEQA